MNASSNGRPRIVELIGPAGVGKSAVAAALGRDPGVLCTSMWNVPRTELAWATVCSVPSSLDLMRRARAPLSREVRHIARMRALLNFLDRDNLSRYRLIVVDEGAVYTLAWLRVIGHQIFADARTAAWRRYVAGLWAATLDGVVRLDASDEVLGQRIRARAKEHILAKAPDAEVRAFSARYREAFAEVLAAMGQYGALSVRDFRTDQTPPERIVAAMIAAPAPRAKELVRG